MAKEYNIGIFAFAVIVVLCVGYYLVQKLPESENPGLAIGVFILLAVIALIAAASKTFK
jgi:hypothetical protein